MLHGFDFVAHNVLQQDGSQDFWANEPEIYNYIHEILSNTLKMALLVIPFPNYCTYLLVVVYIPYTLFVCFE